jgi:hypothetical protein
MLIDSLITAKGPYDPLPHPISADADVAPFGKYKGKHINEFIRDTAYINWLIQQTSLPMRYPEFYEILSKYIKHSLYPPERNAVQAKFVSKELCQILFHHLFSESYAKNTQHRKKRTDLTYKGVVVVVSRFFEYDGWDVVIEGTSAQYWESDTEDKDDVIKQGLKGSIFILIAHELGNDYPFIMQKFARKRGENALKMLIINEYTGTGASFEAVREMFAKSNISIIDYNYLGNIKKPEGVLIIPG